MKFQAHRGVSTEFPENTMISYQAAVDQGYEIIELDPKYTKDGHFVMLHDHSLKRTARDQSGEAVDVLIADITLEEARTYDYGIWKGEEFKGTQIPTLLEVLDFAKNNPGIHIKIDNVWEKFPEDLQDKLLTELAEYGVGASLGLSCTTYECTEKVVRALSGATVHFDGIDMSEETLIKVAEICKGHELYFWVMGKTQKPKWFKGENASVELCERVKKYGHLGVWILSTQEELDRAANVFGADCIETNGQLKPRMLNAE